MVRETFCNVSDVDLGRGDTIDKWVRVLDKTFRVRKKILAHI